MAYINIIALILGVALLVALYYNEYRHTSAAGRIIKDHLSRIAELEEVVTSLEKELTHAVRNTKLELSRRKSSEVRTGKIAEQLACFMPDFPYPQNDIHFIGMPIDLICFTEDHVRFVEVKSGKSALSKKQRAIKKLIEEGKVSFEVYRISGVK